MSLEKRGNIWWLELTGRDGKRVRQSTKTRDKKQAQELHDRLKADLWRQVKLNEKPRRLWNDAVVRWVKETSHKASHEDDKAKLRWLHPHLDGKALDTIDRDMIDTITEAKQNTGCTNATVNRTLALLRSILRRCERDWSWIDRAPAIRLLNEPKKRVRYLTRPEAERLLAELPEHLRDIMTFALATGLRAGNIKGLQWSAIDLDRRLAVIHPDEAKARKAIPVPLNAEALAVLQKQLGKHLVYVFTYQGEPIKQLSTAAWYKAVKRAGIGAFRVHDIRHAWASFHVQGGTPLTILQELGGWSSPAMVQRYAHLGAEHLAPWAEKNGMKSPQSVEDVQRKTACD